MSKLTREQAAAFRERWQAFNKQELEELRNTNLADKLQQTAALMASIQSMGWSETIDSGEAEIWQRWRQLREKYNG